MNKKSMARAGLILIVILLFFLIIFVIPKVSPAAIQVKEIYILGEKFELDLTNKPWAKIKVYTPSKQVLNSLSNQKRFIFRPWETGEYKVEVVYNGKKENYNFKVVSNLTENVSETLFIIDPTKIIDLNVESTNSSFLKIGRPIVLMDEAKVITGVEKKIEIPESSNISVYHMIGNEKKVFLDFELKNNNDGTNSVIIDGIAGNFQVEYSLAAPEKVEKVISEEKKEVTIYTPNGLGYQNVTAFTYLKEFSKSKENLQIYWKEEERYLDFTPYDKNNNGFIDYIEWIVPHLSNQTFEIIYIIKAEHLNSTRDFVEEIYPFVKDRDYLFKEILINHYIRVTFEKLLDSTKDITIYAKSNNSGRVEVYNKDSNTKIADFGIINEDNKYRILLNNLTLPSDTFDLKIINGSVFFDQIIDPSVSINVPGSIVYGQSATTAPRYRNYTGSDFSLEQALTTTGAGVVEWIEVETNPRRNETIIGVLLDNGNLTVIIRNDSSGATTASLYVANVGTTYDAFKIFDIEYEQLSGNALIVYEADIVSADRNINYRIWDGTTLSTQYTHGISSGVVAEPQRVLELIARENSNEILFTTEGGSDDVYAAVWDGSSFVYGLTLTTTNSGGDERNGGLAWEGITGDGLVILGQATGNVFNIYKYSRASNTWSNLTNFSITLGGVPEDISLCTDPTSNYIGFIIQDSGSDVRAFIWNGTSLKTSPTSDTSTENTASRNIACEWGNTNHEAFFMFARTSNAVNLAYFSYNRDIDRWYCSTNNQTITSLNNAVGSNGPCDSAVLSDDPQIVRFSRAPVGDQIMIGTVALHTVTAALQDVEAFIWDGTTLSQTATGGTLEASISSSTGFRSMDLSFKKFGFINNDYPKFANYSVNKTILKKYEIARFSLNAEDFSQELLYLNGTINNINLSFTNLSNNLWYYDWNCTVSDSIVDFSYVYSNDTGFIQKSNSTIISGINLSCDFDLPIINRLSPINSIYSMNNISFNISLNENGSWCGFSLDLEPNISMEANSSNTGFGYYNNSINEGNHSLLFYCNDSAGNSNYTSISYFFIDSIYPLIDYDIYTIENNSNISINSIYINVLVDEINEANITFNLFNSLGIINRTTFNDNRREINFTGLNDGIYYFNVTITDISNQVNTTSTRKITIDTTNPLIQYGFLTETSGFKSTRDWIFLNVSVNETNEDNITFLLFNSSRLIYSDTFYNKERFVNWTDLSSDYYFYNVTIYDSAGNFNFTETRNITLDREGPIINIEHPEPRYYTRNSSLPLNYSILDRLSILDSCYWNIDNSTNQSIICGQNTTFDVPSDGTYTLYFYSNDSLNNLGRNQVTFSVSTAGPAISLEYPDNNIFINYNTSIGFNYTPRDPDGVSTCYFYSNWSGNWEINAFDNGISNYSINTFLFEGLSEGQFIWNIRCNDTNNLFKFSLNNFTLGIDVTNPLINFLSATPADNSNLSIDFIYINVTINELNLANITFNLFNDSGIIQRNVYTNQTNEINWSYLSEGTYYYNVTIYDLANNFNFTETRKITLDRTSPDAILNIPPNGTYYNISTQNLSVNISDNIGIKEAILNVWNQTALVNVTTLPITGIQVSAGVVYSFLYDGIFKWFYRINDFAGNYYITNNNTITIDTTLPSIMFGSGTDSNGSIVEKDSIFVNLSLSEINIANITFNLYNNTNGRTLVNSSLYEYFISSVNFTELNSANVTYYFNVTSNDLANNINFTLTNTVKLVDITKPNLNLLSPLNLSYDSNESLILGYEVSDIHLDSCYYNLNNGANITLENCQGINFDSPEGSNTLRLFANDSTGNRKMVNVTFVANNSLRVRYPGMLVYGEGVLSTPKFRIWSRSSFSSESSAGPVNGIIKWLRLTGNPKQEEYMLASYTNNSVTEVQMYSYLSDGTLCWNDGSTCNSTLFLANTATIMNKTSFDVAFEQSSGDGLVVYSNGSRVPKYMIWNQSGWSDELDVGQTKISGNIDFIKMAEQPGTDEIALIIGSGASLSYIIWDGSAWGCEPSSAVSTTMTPDLYQSADLAYEQISGDLFIAISVDVTSEIDYITKAKDTCAYSSSRTANMIEEGEEVTVGARYGGNEIMIVQYDIGSDDMHAVVWGGNSMLQISGNEQGLYATDVTPTRIIAASFAGTSNRGILIYSDAATSLNIDYLNYYVNNNTWNPSANPTTGLDAIGATNFADEEENILAISYIDENKSMIIVKDDLDRLWAKTYNGVTNAFSDSDSGTTLETSTSSPSYMSFDFVFRKDEAGPPIFVRSPSLYKNQSQILFNITLGEEANSCQYSLDLGINNISMITEDRINFYHNNLDVLEGNYSVNIYCSDRFNNPSKEEFNLIVDISYPLIYFGIGSEDNNSYFARNSIYVNVSVIETNEANITFNLYNPSGLVNSTTFSDLRREINWTGLTDSRYYYNVSVNDYTGNINTSEVRTITLDMTNPNGTLITPLNDTISNVSSQNLTVNATDNIQLKNVTLNIYNSTDGLINQTIRNVTGTNPIVGIVYSFLYDGIFKWFYRIADIAGNSFETQNNTITIDTTKALIQFISPTEINNSNVSKNNIYVNVSVSEINEANITFNLYNPIGLVNSTTLTDSRREINWTGLTDSRYYYNVSVNDRAGNINTSEVRVITLDTTYPLVYFGIGSDNNDSFVRRNSIYVNVSVSEINEANITFNLYNSAGLVNSTSFSNRRRTINWTGLTDSRYYYNVSVNDYAGNINTSEVRTITLDKTYPLIYFGIGSENNNSYFARNSIYVNVSVIETNEANITFNLYNFTSLINSTTLTDSRREINWSLLNDSRYYYNVSVNDLAGNINTSEVRTITLDRTNPNGTL
ncbi:MAG: hypothetical protein WC867_07180, partial [Candidatus Pacearchaeota archaeon]